MRADTLFVCRLVPEEHHMNRALSFYGIRRLIIKRQDTQTTRRRNQRKPYTDSEDPA